MNFDFQCEILLKFGRINCPMGALSTFSYCKAMFTQESDRSDRTCTYDSLNLRPHLYFYATPPSKPDTNFKTTMLLLLTLRRIFMMTQMAKNYFHHFRHGKNRKFLWRLDWRWHLSDLVKLQPFPIFEYRENSIIAVSYNCVSDNFERREHGTFLVLVTFAVEFLGPELVFYSNSHRLYSTPTQLLNRFQVLPSCWHSLGGTIYLVF
jgi:hypothetical protein